MGALKLMNEAAAEVMRKCADIILAFGESDEYSFCLRKGTNFFNRREDKILTTVVSYFSAAYVFHWNKFIPAKLSVIPSFDGRIVLYPSIENLKDYISWRQADTHINNLYNTTFWALVLKGKSTEEEAHQILKGSFAKDKNEILFSKFGINYNNEEPIFKKGTLLIKKNATEIIELHEDAIKDEFWDKYTLKALLN
jgi:tRNA(His) guanylyltransferase